MELQKRLRKEGGGKVDIIMRDKNFQRAFLLSFRFRRLGLYIPMSSAPSPRTGQAAASLQPPVRSIGSYDKQNPLLRQALKNQ